MQSHKQRGGVQVLCLLIDFGRFVRLKEIVMSSRSMRENLINPIHEIFLMFRRNLVRCALILSGKGFYSFFSFGAGGGGAG
jgi:hypothetical protein